MQSCLYHHDRNLNFFKNNYYIFYNIYFFYYCLILSHQSCIEYDVSSAPVSIHLPLSRLVAGLSLHLDK